MCSKLGSSNLKWAYIMYRSMHRIAAEHYISMTGLHIKTFAVTSVLRFRSVRRPYAAVFAPSGATKKNKQKTLFTFIYTLNI